MRLIKIHNAPVIGKMVAVGWLYFVTFIDDYSRLGLCFEIKRPSVGKVQRVHASVERQSGKKLKCIRTDNGGEYCGPFDIYCMQHGIAHEKTPPKTP